MISTDEVIEESVFQECFAISASISGRQSSPVRSALHHEHPDIQDGESQ